MTLSWIGNQAGSGAYPTICRQMARALTTDGLLIAVNLHNIENKLTEVAVTCGYPPALPSTKHRINAAYFTWEFPGIDSFPKSFLKVFNQLDVLVTMSGWVAEQVADHVSCEVKVVPPGFDPVEFSLSNYDPVPPREFWKREFDGEGWPDEAEHILLWVGGSDKRHGADIMLSVFDELPKSYHLVMKWDTHYPKPETYGHSRIHFLYRDYPSLAPLYRAADVLVQTARGVGFSLPVLEAVSLGARVVSTALPPIREFGEGMVTFASEGRWVPFRHHLHADCLPVWWEPDIFCLAEQVQVALAHPTTLDQASIELLFQFRRDWSWLKSAQRIRQVFGV